MSQQTTIRKLAALVNTPVEKLLEQLSEAGMAFTGPDQVVTSTEKVKLLGFLRRTHGKADKPAEDPVAPKKITLNRTRKQELTVGGGKNRSTVDVVVRRKVTLVKPANETANADGTPGVDDEQAEILRKLEESRQRNLSEQQRLAEEDQRRANAAAELKRQQDAEAERLRKEAEQAAGAGTGAAEPDADAAARKPAHGHGHPKPAPARDERGTGPKHKGNRGSHAMVAGVEDDENTARFAGQLHLSPTERARRSTTSRSKPKSRRQVEQSRSGAGPHGFERPTAPVVREVAIGEAITVADLAQKLALKGGDVVKALFKMGVMATITQSIDHDTAVLVVEELGHKAVAAESNDAESELLAHAGEVQGEPGQRPTEVTIRGPVVLGMTYLLD